MRKKIGYELDQGEIKELSHEEIAIILRCADDIIARGGRSMLTRILKGSKDKIILQYDLQKSPVYGVYHDKTLKDITHMIDWCIIHYYLEIEYNGRLPKLVYSLEDWKIEKVSYAKEWYDKFKKMSQNQSVQKNELLKLLNVNRQIVMLLLDMIEKNHDVDMVDLLLIWKESEVIKVKRAIDCVLRSLEN